MNDFNEKSESAVGLEAEAVQQDTFAGSELPAEGPSLPAVPAPAKKPKKKWTNKEEVMGWTFVGIPLLGFLIFGMIPLCMSIYISLYHFPSLSLTSDYSNPWVAPKIVEFVGFDNFKEVLTDPQFWTSVLNTLFVVFTTIVSLALSIFISMMLYHCKRGKKLFQTVFFIPYVCSMVAIAFVFRVVFNKDPGILNSILWNVGYYHSQEEVINWLVRPDRWRFVMFVVMVWSGTGFNIILLSAAMTNINKNIYEAADIDGAGMFTKFFKVTLPAISPTVFYLLVTGIIGSLQEFARYQIMAKGVDVQSDAELTIVYYLYNKLFDPETTMPNLGVATAVGWILALLIGLVTFGNFKISKKWVSYDE